jgi:polysaccharide biosynthesis protein PslH
MLVQPGGTAGSGSPEGARLIELDVRRGVSGIVAKAVSRFPLRSPRPTRSAIRRARSEVARFRPDVCIMSDVLAWSFVSRLLPAKPWIYDAHNVETYLYRSFRDDAASLSDRLTFAVDYRRIAANERRAVARATAVVAVSMSDEASLATLAQVARSVVIPSSVPLPREAAIPAEAAPIVLFVGSLDYPPNIAALEELVSVVIPLVRAELPAARLVVVGRRPSRPLRDLLTGSPWIELRDNVPDLSPSYREARCVILPIRSGGGSRLKVYEALSYGVPLVATSLAVSGVPLTPGIDVMVTEEAEGLANAAILLLDNDDDARGLGSAGRTTFERSLSWARAGEPLTMLLDELTSGS